MKVLKFGGTSVGSASAIKQLAEIVAGINEPVVVVVSAMGGVTNKLINAGNLAAAGDSSYQTLLDDITSLHFNTCLELFDISNRSGILSEVKVQLNQIQNILESVYTLKDLSPKTMAVLSSSGELLSSFMVCQYLNSLKNKGFQLLDSQKIIKTEGDYLGGKLLKDLTYSNIQSSVDTGEKYVAAGFIASNINDEVSTLGRGGSDYTAAIFAGALQATQLEIWTDVSGMYTTNPKLVQNAFPIEHISYQEAMELSHFGAKVIYPPTIIPAQEAGIPILIKNTFEPLHEGTTISNKVNHKAVVSGLSHVENIALLTLEGAGMVGIPGFSMRLFKTLAENKINVIFITQASSEHSICFAIERDAEQDAISSLNNEFAYEISLKKINPIVSEQDLAIVALVGDNMKNHQGISGKMFYTLGRNNISVRAIAQGASERNISTVIHQKHISKALNVLHEAFFEEHKSVLNLFIVGVGNVGKKLLQQIQTQSDYLKENLKLNLRIIGLANSKKILASEEGIDLNNWQLQLESGQNYQFEQILETIKQFNLPNTILIDNTASDLVSHHYENFLRESIAVVTCNKIACSSSLENYKKLKLLSRKYNAPFLYETNVGAGLPVINTLQNLVASGDKIEEIQAVLSGSLNFIFNNYDTTQPFVEVVQKAGEEGYTEPDPRIDLSGIDVMRKILILARESGFDLNIEEVQSNSFLPESALKGDSVDDFMIEISKNENHFKSLFHDAEKQNCQLKFVASLKNGKASVGLQQIAPTHPFYNLKGKDNIVLFFTNRYNEQPLIVKGAGAGAEVTASGIFADIIKLANQ